LFPSIIKTLSFLTHLFISQCSFPQTFENISHETHK
jgi:hypothetical protein